VSAPVHRARDTIALLSREMPDFISPDQWPPNSPDMNPVDYKIWAVMQQRVYEKRVNDVDELCQQLLSVWRFVYFTYLLFLRSAEGEATAMHQGNIR